MFRLIIAGSRGYNYYQGVKNSFFQYIQSNNLELQKIQIISGGARGPDSLAVELAKELNIPYIIFEADWEKFGKSAGMKRNKEMAENADGLLAIWDTKSSGTKNMIELALETNLLVNIIEF